MLLNITGNNVGLAFVIPSYFANIAVLQSVIVSLNSASVMLCCCHCCSLGTGTPECSLVPTSDPSLGRTVFGGPTYPPRHFGKSALNSGHVFFAFGIKPYKQETTYCIIIIYIYFLPLTATVVSQPVFCGCVLAFHFLISTIQNF